MQANIRELHFPHALGRALAADVDLPVEEFFFRLDPAVEQLLAQGVPAAYCNVNIHHHLRRSYEMLASLKMQVGQHHDVCKKIAGVFRNRRRVFIDVSRDEHFQLQSDLTDASCQNFAAFIFASAAAQSPQAASSVEASLYNIFLPQLSITQHGHR